MEQVTDLTTSPFQNISGHLQALLRETHRIRLILELHVPKI